MNRLQIFVLAFWLGAVTMTGFFAIDNISYGIEPFTEYQVIDSLKTELKLYKQLDSLNKLTIKDLNIINDRLLNTKTVTATIYYPTGDEMRSGKEISEHYTLYSTPIRYIAISQDLWSNNGGPYSFGDSIKVTGMGTTYDGIYVVEDTMNKRFTKRIDVLVESKKPPNIWFNVKIYKV